MRKQFIKLYDFLQNSSECEYKFFFKILVIFLYLESYFSERRRGCVNFENIYELYFKDVYLFLRSISAREDIAEEMTQETFVKALKAIDRFDGKKDIRAWLFTIAKNTYYTYCKRQKIYANEMELDDIPTKQTTISEKMVDEETAFLVHRFLHHMNQPYKEVFTLRVFGELSFEKIALLFGKSPNWARVTFYRAKKQIMKYMEEIEHGKNPL